MFIPGSETAFFGSWSFVGLSGAGIDHPDDIGLDNAEGFLLLYYNVPDGYQVWGTCNWAWQATCISDCPGPPKMVFSQAEYKVREDVGEVTITVKRKGNRDDQVTVDYATSNGTAKASEDYTAKSGTLTFPSDVYTQTFTVPIIENDPPIEGVKRQLDLPVGDN